MFGVGDTIKMALAAIAGAAICGALGYLYVSLINNPSVRAQARDKVIAEAREHAMDLINKRNKDNAEISTFDRAALCHELGGVWVQPDDRCD